MSSFPRSIKLPMDHIRYDLRMCVIFKVYSLVILVMHRGIWKLDDLILYPL